MKMRREKSIGNCMWKKKMYIMFIMNVTYKHFCLKDFFNSFLEIFWIYKHFCLKVVDFFNIVWTILKEERKKNILLKV